MGDSTPVLLTTEKTETVPALAVPPVAVGLSSTRAKRGVLVSVPQLVSIQTNEKKPRNRMLFFTNSIANPLLDQISGLANYNRVRCRQAGEGQYGWLVFNSL